MHRVNWTFGGEKYWYADDTLKEIKIFSAQHTEIKMIPYPSVSNAHVQFLKGDYGVTQTSINPDNLLEMVWLIVDSSTNRTLLKIINEQNNILFSYEYYIESVNFSEIDGFSTKLFISEYEDGIDDYITRVYTLPTFSLENIYFRANRLHRKNFGYAGEMYFYKDVINEKIQIYDAKHRFCKSIKSRLSGVYFDYDDEEYTDADDSYYVKDSLVEVSFSYTNSSSGDYGQIIMNENGQTLYKSNFEFRIDRQKNLVDKLFTETWRNTTDNFFKTYNLPNSIPFIETSTLRAPFARVFLKNYGETIYSGFNPLVLSFSKIANTKSIQLPTVQSYWAYCYPCYSGIRDYYKYSNVSDTLINKDSLIEIIYVLANDHESNFITSIANDTGFIYQRIDSTKLFSLNNFKGLMPKLITKTGNNNPYNTKVWRLGGATTPLKAPPSVFDLKIYPNPSQYEMNIELLGEDEGNVFNISVYNTLGQNVFSTNSSSARNWVLRKKEIGVGAFILKVNSGQKSVNKKIVFD